ncbi:DUF6221 family protein [Phytoactinopolyspora mesophila]|uniref:Uncharacterized protein n=1 Tax=Phytoactinopolyspora mesophila TaxID=2650750 RepID=A0A7K3M2F2_9ACTN|nr:DUF6221 family protein [Phytoactinopolyspora mesophila]NDL57466.1 hypothetical protein [Phytoactinopolyspora mesophila]
MAEDELAAFLRERLDELETAALAAARSAGGLFWGADAAGDVVLEPMQEPGMAAAGEADEIAPLVAELDDAGWHVALQSPARVLAGIEAKRGLIDQCLMWQREAAQGGRGAVVAIVAENVLSLLALPWADHEDYQPVWRLS